MIPINPQDKQKKKSPLQTVGTVSDITASIAGLVGKTDGEDTPIDKTNVAFMRRQKQLLGLT